MGAGVTGACLDVPQVPSAMPVPPGTEMRVRALEGPLGGAAERPAPSPPRAAATSFAPVRSPATLPSPSRPAAGARGWEVPHGPAATRAVAPPPSPGTIAAAPRWAPPSAGPEAIRAGPSGSAAGGLAPAGSPAGPPRGVGMLARHRARERERTEPGGGGGAGTDAAAGAAASPTTGRPRGYGMLDRHRARQAAAGGAVAPLPAAPTADMRGGLTAVPRGMVGTPGGAGGGVAPRGASSNVVAPLPVPAPYTGPGSALRPPGPPGYRSAGSLPLLPTILQQERLG